MYPDYQHRLRWVFIAMILTGLVLVGGCRSRTPVRSDSPADPGPGTAETTETSTPAPAPVAHDAVTGLFLLRNDRVGYVQRTVSVPTDSDAENTALLEPTLEALLGGPLPQETSWGFASAIPPETEVLGVSVSDTLATVNLNGRFMADADALSVRQRVAQVVFTLTALDGIERVALEVDGEPLREFAADTATLGLSMSRDDFADVRPSILIVSPAPGETITSPVQVSGESNTPAGTFIIEIIGTHGTTVTERLADSSGTNGIWRAFETSVDFETGAGPGELVAYGRSPVDDSRAFEIRIPVVFGE